MIDDDVKEFLRIQQIEEDRMFEFFNSLKNKRDILKLEKIEPSSSDLWFTGLKKYGQEFADREYELGGRGKQDRKS